MNYSLIINDHKIATIKATGQQNTIDPTVVAAEILRFFNVVNHLEVGKILYTKSGRRWFVAKALIDGKQEVMNGFLEEVN